MKNSQIVEFIKKQLSIGQSKEKIRNDLLSNGWTNTDIDEAIVASTSGDIPISPSVKKSSKKIPIAISLILLVMLGGGLFAFKVYKNDLVSKMNVEGIVENNTIETVDTSNNLIQQTDSAVEQKTQTGLKKSATYLPIPLTSSYITPNGDFEKYPIILKINNVENFTSFEDKSVITFSWNASWADSCTLGGFISPVDASGNKSKLQGFVGNSGTQKYQVTYGGKDYPQEIVVSCSSKNLGKDSGVYIGVAVTKPQLSSFTFTYPTSGTILSRGVSKNMYVNEPTITTIRWNMPKLTSIRLALYDASTNSPVPNSDISTPVRYEVGRGNFVAWQYGGVKDGNYYIKVNEINFTPSNIKSPTFKIVTTNTLETSDINKKVLSMMGNILEGSHLSNYSTVCGSEQDVANRGDGVVQTINSLKSQLPNSDVQCKNITTSFAVSLNLENDQRYNNVSWCIDSLGYYGSGTIDASKALCK